MKELGVFNIKPLRNRRRQLRRDDTEAERIIWEELRNNKLGYRFVRQFSVKGYIIDFYCPKYKLGIELEGEIHKRKDTKIYDKYRNDYLGAFNIKILYIPNDETIKNIDVVLDKIRQGIIQM